MKVLIRFNPFILKHDVMFVSALISDTL